MTAALLALAFATTTPADAAGWLVPPLELDLAALSATEAPSPGRSSGSPREKPPLSPARAEGPGEGSPRAVACEQPHWKSPALALGLSLALELPTLLIGPSLGHLYAGEWQHFALTGGARLADVTLLVLLEKFAPGFGIGPLYALGQLNFAGGFTGYPLGFTVDLVLVLALVGSAIYDLVDAWRAAERYDLRHGLAPPPGPSPAAAAALPPPAR